MRSLLFALCLLLAMGLDAAPTAEACAPPGEVHLSHRSFFPANSSFALPTNVQLQVHYGYHGDERFSAATKKLFAKMRSFALREAGESRNIPLKQSEWSGKSPPLSGILHVTLKPLSELKPNTRYRLLSPIEKLPCFSTGSSCQGATPVEIASFTTGASPDTQAPSFGGLEQIVTSRFPVSFRPCPLRGRPFPFTWKWAPAKDPGSGAMLRYNIYKLSDLKVPVMAGVKATELRGFFQCDVAGDLVLEGTLFAGASAKYVVRAMDVAGNEEQNSRTQLLPDLCKGPPEPSHEPPREAAHFETREPSQREPAPPKREPAPEPLGEEPQPDAGPSRPEARSAGAEETKEPPDARPTSPHCSSCAVASSPGPQSVLLLLWLLVVRRRPKASLGVAHEDGKSDPAR